MDLLGRYALSLTWSSMWVFCDAFLRGRTRRGGDMEMDKLRAGGPAPAVSYVYSILRSPESYVQLPGGERNRVSRNL